MTKSKNTLTLYFTPSPCGFDWGSPQKVALSAVKNKLSMQKRFMGHVYVELNGTLSSGAKVNIVTGMRSKKLNALPLLLLKGYGLGILFHSFDGHLETKDEIWPEINELADKGKLSFLELKINTDAVDLISQYYNQYKENDIHNYYGNFHRPLHGEGAGCSAFGASFLTLTETMEQDFLDSWTTKLKLPMKFIGNPVQKKWISLLRILALGHSWADENQEHQELHFWDPDKMHRWVLAKTDAHTDNSDYELSSLKNAPGIVIDKTHQTIDSSKHIWRHVSEGDKPHSVLPQAPFKGPWLD